MSIGCKLYLVLEILTIILQGRLSPLCHKKNIHYVVNAINLITKEALKKMREFIVVAEREKKKVSSLEAKS